MEAPYQVAINMEDVPSGAARFCLDRRERVLMPATCHTIKWESTQSPANLVGYTFCWTQR